MVEIDYLSVLMGNRKFKNDRDKFLNQNFFFSVINAPISRLQFLNTNNS